MLIVMSSTSVRNTSPQPQHTADLSHHALVARSYLGDLVGRELEHLRQGGERIIEVTLLEAAHEDVLEEGEVDAPFAPRG